MGAEQSRLLVGGGKRKFEGPSADGSSNKKAKVTKLSADEIADLSSRIRAIVEGTDFDYKLMNKNREEKMKLKAPALKIAKLLPDVRVFNATWLSVNPRTARDWLRVKEYDADDFDLGDGGLLYSYQMHKAPKKTYGTRSEDLKMIYFCDDQELCLNASTTTNYIWIVYNVTKLKLLQINTWRHQFLSLFYQGHIHWMMLEAILSRYLLEQKLDGWQVAAKMDQLKTTYDDPQRSRLKAYKTEYTVFRSRFYSHFKWIARFIDADTYETMVRENGKEYAAKELGPFKVQSIDYDGNSDSLSSPKASMEYEQHFAAYKKYMRRRVTMFDIIMASPFPTAKALALKAMQDIQEGWVSFTKQQLMWMYYKSKCRANVRFGPKSQCSEPAAFGWIAELETEYPAKEPIVTMTLKLVALDRAALQVLALWPTRVIDNVGLGYCLKLYNGLKPEMIKMITNDPKRLYLYPYDVEMKHDRTDVVTGTTRASIHFVYTFTYSEWIDNYDYDTLMDNQRDGADDPYRRALPEYTFENNRWKWDEKKKKKVSQAIRSLTKWGSIVRHWFGTNGEQPAGHPCMVNQMRKLSMRVNNTALNKALKLALATPGKLFAMSPFKKKVEEKEKTEVWKRMPESKSDIEQMLISWLSKITGNKKSGKPTATLS